MQQMIEAHGGFTVRLRTGEPVRSGISVVTRPSQSLTFLRNRWCDADVRDWLMTVATGPAWRSVYIGGWLDPRSDMVWLDVVRVVPPPLRRVACVLGRVMQQHCVFDLGRRETVVLR
ncbi:MAG: hypothetical protein ACR2LO_00295 [Ilumatobacteraceae bacterium]